MGQKLLPAISKEIVLLCAFLLGLFAPEGYGQTMLSKGEIVIVTVNAGESESFDFVPLVDLEAGTEIHFTDNAFVEAEGILKGDEGTVTYTAPASISAGSVISYGSRKSTGFETSGNFSMDSDGDNIIVYQTPNNANTYLYGIGWGRGNAIWEYDIVSTFDNHSDIPPRLAKADDTILGLGEFQNYQYQWDIGLTGTPNAVLEFIGEPSNWKGRDLNSYSIFEHTFTLVAAPAVAFTSAKQKVKEGEVLDLTVELVEAHATDVSVDVVYEGDESTAVRGDDVQFEGNQQLTFLAEDSAGTTKTISILLNEDGEREGSETAIFELQNISAGTIIDPATVTATVEDAADAHSGIVINEIYAAPNDERGDADGDGVTDEKSDEFIEFVNKTTADIDISGWTLSDQAGLRHTFPQGTVIKAEGALVLFGSAEQMPQGNFGGAVIQRSNESSSLDLDDDGDRIYLRDEGGTEVIAFSYGSTNEHSLVRNPERTGGITEHSEVSSTGSLFSPGTTVDGKAFGSDYAMGVRGSEGWRMISTPSRNTSFEDLLGNFWMQGIPGSDDPNGAVTLAGWDEAQGTFSDIPSDMSQKMVPGKGYIMYVSESTAKRDRASQDKIAEVITTNETENNSPVRIGISANDTNGENGIDAREGWNLLGNPFGVELSVPSLIKELGAVSNSVNAHVYVWKNDKGNGNGAFVPLGTGDRVAPFQAFFVRFIEPIEEQNIQLNKEVLQSNNIPDLYQDDSFSFDFFLHGEQYYDSYTVQFSEKGKVDIDRYDAYKLFSLNPNSLNLYSTVGNNRLGVNVLPNRLESPVEIPISFDANGAKTLMFKWGTLEALPEGWNVQLIDTKINREIDLRTAREYRFSAPQTEDDITSGTQTKLLNMRKGTDSESRFLLAIDPGVRVNQQNEMPESVQLKPNYPNPFNASTTIPYELTQDSEVKLTVWNMIGQKVATLVEGSVEAGTYEETWNAGNMPSGIYIARFEVNGTVFTRKMTLIK